MSESASTALQYFSDLYSHNRALQQIRETISERGTPATSEAINLSIQNYNQAIGLVEDEIWSEEPDERLIERYQQLYRELEQLFSLKGDDRRHKFIITIPVADRPQHLQSCLGSLLKLCRAFNYGGTDGDVAGRFSKVMVLIADDSKDERSISRNREITRQFNLEGIETLYFGIDEQIQQLDRLSGRERNSLQNILGDIDRDAFYHKGASIMRNIAYLKLRELACGEENALLYFIDSDQEFRIKAHAQSGEQDLYAISFFHALDQIFSQEKIEILTGKVVGDPPVSPSVMAGNFLEDVITFLHQMAELTPEVSCQFHNQERQRVDDASYHDMADLFGFKPALESYHYNCTLPNPHDHVACFIEFSNKLNRFFDGEHPTRKTYYEHNQLLSSITAARTIYTGNYIFRPTVLNYFIPFATLKLRMAGPVLGRIIKSEIGAKFVSANLPMLHKRIVHETGQSEFRPGINRERAHIDLSGEFERQFFGDVMLFTIENLTQDGYPQKRIPNTEIRETVHSVESIMHQKYQTKQISIGKKLSLLKSLFNDSEKWWNSSDGLRDAKDNFSQFITNIEHNFGGSARAYKLIGSDANRVKRLDEIVDAIAQYSDDRSSWNSTLIK